MALNTQTQKLLRGPDAVSLSDFAGCPAGTYTQTYSTASRTVAADGTSDFPAGGTGAAAGGWDTAGHRDAAIASFNALRADFLALKQNVGALIDDLQALGLIA